MFRGGGMSGQGYLEELCLLVSKGFSKQQVELVIKMMEDVLVGQQDLNLITSFYQFSELLDVQCADSYEEHVCNSGKTGTSFCPGHTYRKITRC